MRSASTSIFRGWGLILAPGIFLAPLEAQNILPESSPVAEAKYQQAVLIHFQGTITSRLEQYTYRKLDQAQKLGADLVIIQIDSPGGELEASLRLANYFRDLAWAHTVAYVPEQALSGAAIAALGCQEIVLRPQAVLGDAGPIVMDFMEFGFRHAPEKVQTDLARRIRDLATKHNRPAAIAEAMVDKDLVVHRVRHRENAREQYMSEEEINAATDPGQWQKLNQVLESRPGKFLEVSGKRATELGLADATIDDTSELQQRYRLTKPPLTLQRQFVDSAVDLLNSPWITTFLFAVGLVALYIELSVPGVNLGGLIAILCFTLFFWSRFLGGTAGWLEVILFVTGIVFIIAELFFIPGFGVAGVSGLVLVLVSLVMAGQNFLVPETATEMHTFARTIFIIAGSSCLVVGGIAITTWFLGELPLLGRLALRPSKAASNTADSPSQHQTFSEVQSQSKLLQVGDIGFADSPLRPAGVARFEDDYRDVISEGTFIEKGRSVKVIQMSGNRIVVRDIDDLAAS